MAIRRPDLDVRRYLADADGAGAIVDVELLDSAPATPAAPARTGNAAATLGPVVSEASGRARASGSGGASLGSLGGSGAGATRATGSASRTLGGLGAVATGDVGAQEAIGTGAATLGAVTGAAVGQTALRASGASLLGSLASAATAAAKAAGQASATLGGLGSEGAATARIGATGSAELGVLIGEAVGVAAVRASAAAVLEPLTGTARGGVPSDGRFACRSGAAASFVVRSGASAVFVQRSAPSTTLRARIRAMTLHVGDTNELELDVYSRATGLLTDPTSLALIVTSPSGAVTTIEPTKLATGRYRALVDCTAAGRWRFVWSSPGPTCKGTYPGYFDVEPTVIG